MGQELPSGYRYEEFEFIRSVGDGGFGITYIGYDHHFDQAVAIKEYFPIESAVRVGEHEVGPRSEEKRADFEFGIERQLDEAKTLAKLEELKLDHIVKVKRFFRANGTAYMVMEFAEGSTLKDIIVEHGKLSVEDTKKLMLPLLLELELVHRNDILHRDIKPSNLIVDPSGKVVLIDFGAAKQVTQGRSQSLSAIVSEGYAPMEQYSTQGKQGPWTDIYAMAAVMYACVTGNKPVDATARVEEDPLPPLTEILGAEHQEFAKAVDAGLAVFSKDRPRSVNDWLAMFGVVGPTKPLGKPGVTGTPNGEKPGSVNPAGAGKGRQPESVAKRLGFVVLALAGFLSIVSLQFVLREFGGASSELFSSGPSNDIVLEAQMLVNLIGDHNRASEQGGRDYRVPETGELDSATQDALTQIFSYDRDIEPSRTDDAFWSNPLAFMETPRLREIQELAESVSWKPENQTLAIGAIEDFMIDYPDFHDPVALEYLLAKVRNTAFTYRAFLSNHAGAAQASEVRELLEKLLWDQATAANTVDAYRTYLGDTIEGTYAQEARDRIERLQRELAERTQPSQPDPEPQQSLPSGPSRQREDVTRQWQDAIERRQGQPQQQQEEAGGYSGPDLSSSEQRRRRDIIEQWRREINRRG